MSVAARRYKILAHMFSRGIRNLDQIQNCRAQQRGCVDLVPEVRNVTAGALRFST